MTSHISGCTIIYILLIVSLTYRRDLHKTKIKIEKNNGNAQVSKCLRHSKVILYYICTRAIGEISVSIIEVRDHNDDIVNVAIVTVNL